MKSKDVFLIIVVGVITTIIGNIVWKRMEARGPARVLAFEKAGGCGCGCS